MYIVHLLLDSNNNSNISTRANLEETIGNAIHARRVFIEISHSLTLAVKTFLLDQTEVMILHRGTRTHAHTRLISRFFRFRNETRQSYDNSTRVCSTSRFRSRFREKGKLFQNKESKLEKVIEREVAL